MEVSSISNIEATGFAFLAGGGEMGNLIRRHPWPATPVGHPATWPACLRSTLTTVLHAPFPMVLYWGEELTCFYNDAFLPSLGREGKHPSILGKKAEEAWPEVWPTIQPLLKDVLTKGKSFQFEDRLVPIFRNGKMEDVYWTFSQSPVHDEEGNVRGVLVVCKETTKSVTRFQNVVEQSGMPIVIFKGEDLIIDTANEAALATWGVGKEAIGKPYLEIAPESAEQEIVPLLRQVYQTGVPQYGTERLVYHFDKDGSKKYFYFNFEFKPFLEAGGHISGVTVIANDVTQQVLVKKQLELTLNNFPSAIHLFDKDAQLILTNEPELKESAEAKDEEAIERKTLFSLQQDRMKTMLVQDEQGNVLPPQDSPTSLTFRTGKSAERVVKYTNKQTGAVKWSLHRATPLLDEERNVSMVLTTSTDLTLQKEATAQIAANEARFRGMFENAAVGICLRGVESDWQIVNQKLCDILGYQENELVQLSFQQITHPDDLQEDLALMQEVVDGTRQTYSLEKRYLHKNGNAVWINMTLSLIRDAAGTPRYFIIIVEDIHERKKAELALRQSEERFHAAVAAVNGILWTNSASGEMQGEQPGWAALTGQTFDEYQGYGWAGVVHPDDAQPTINAWNEAVREQKPFVFEHRLRMKNGEWGQFSIQAIPIIHADGIVREWVGVHTNITEQRRAEKAMRESEERFRSFSNNITNLAWIADGEGWISWYNQRWYNYTGTTLEEMQGWGWEKVHHPDHIAQVMDFVKTAWTKDEPWELTFPLRRHDGEYRWFLTRAVPIKNEQGEIYRWIGTNTDIHEQIKAQEDLRLAKEQLELTFENVPSAIYLFDKAGKILYLNERAAKKLGCASAVEVLAQKDTIDIRQKLLQEYTILTEKGEPAVAGDFSSALTFSNHQPTQVLLKYIHRDTGDVTWYWSRSTPLFNDKGELILLLTTSTDVTAQQAFTEKLEDEVEQRTRELQASNQDLQQFAHVASHDLKEPVRKIRTFAGRLQSDKHSVLSPNGQLFLAKIEASAQRMYDMIDGVLTYSTFSATQEEPAPVDLTEILRHVESDLEVVIQQKGATLAYANLPVVKGASVLIHQLFYNLVNNSLKFSRAGVPPQIDVTAQAVVYQQRRFAEITVRDNGIGFEQEQASRIFQTFTRLNSKDNYEGTGLGLSLCKKIVERHGGAIWANGVPGQGAEIIVRLPCE